MCSARTGSGYGLENAFHQGHVRGLPEQVDSAPLGEVSLSTRQRWRGGTLVEVVDAGKIELRQNQKSHERLQFPNFSAAKHWKKFGDLLCR